MFMIRSTEAMISYFHKLKWQQPVLTSLCRCTSSKKLELERVLSPARRPSPVEKLAVNETSTRYYTGLNLLIAIEPFAGLVLAQKLHLFSECCQAQRMVDSKRKAR